MREAGFKPLVRVLRGERTESVHWGVAVAVASDGEVVAEVGDSRRAVYWRSTAKPFQIWPLVDSGAAARFGVTAAELAVACASHGAEDGHLQAVASLLAKGGFTAADLQCGPHPPMHRPTADGLVRQGRAPEAVHNNCSGKHAGMLMLARHLGVDPTRYLDPDGPVQKAILRSVAAHAGVAAAGVGVAVDGCSAPTFHLPLRCLARAYAALAASLDGNGGAGDALRTVARSMADHPRLVAGGDRLDTALMEARPGRLIAKVGAEGMYAVAAHTASGPLGLAVKIADGDGERARTALVLEFLTRCGALGEAERQALSRRFPPLVRNHRGLEVGRVEVSLPRNLRGATK